MKKILLLFSVLLLLGVTSCSQNEDIKGTNELPNVTDNEGINPKVAEEPTPSENGSITENENSNPPENGNTSDNESEEPANESPEPTTYENNSFKDVSLTENGNGVNVTGKARVFEGVFQYAVVLKD